MINKIKTGADLETWRLSHQLTLEEATGALGTDFRKLAASTSVGYQLELLLALYDLTPGAGVWPAKRIDLATLFKDMFSDVMFAFEGTPHQTTARVDCEVRLSAMLGCSKNTIYQSIAGSRTNLPVTSLILSKLSQSKNPGRMLEAVSKTIWEGRGVDIDVMHPVPTLRHPPRRERRGRKSHSKTTSI